MKTTPLQFAAPPRRRARISAFTLVELMVAMAVMVAATGMALITFHSVSKAWQRGTSMSQDIDHGDFVLDQLAMALRSAYFPDAPGTQAVAYGFWLTDGGSGPYARDSISWVKMGPALVGSASHVAGGPHRVRISVENTDNSRSVLAVRAWRPYAQPEDFREEDVAPFHLSPQVVGFDCRVATNVLDNELDWQDLWEETNRIPPAVEIAVYLKPLAEGEPPVEMKRCVGIPVSPLSWR